MVLDAFYIRFENINKIFERIGKSDKNVREISVTTCASSRFYNHPSSHIVMDKVDRACRIHRRLSKLARNMGHAFSIYFLAFVAQTVIVIIQLGATFIWLSHFEKNSTLKIIASCTTFTFNIFQLWQNIWSCSSVSKEANKIGSLLFLVPINDPAVHHQLQELSIYFMQESVGFSAGGTCSIDRSLASAAFCSIVKYLIILLQMKSD
ncbi:uncharacterized protein LOC125501396 [Athalia rosae]|uniref:uncharacterized protein LOC125501396 n=1 Tax=Athalia rosae TaxID=37344 RepID=UPI002033FC03|nr:uncharacterized protein LOC125501396 [Athalia rosae]